MRGSRLAEFDPFENQGGASALDPEQAAEVKKLTEKLLADLASMEDEPGAGPVHFDEEASE